MNAQMDPQQKRKSPYKPKYKQPQFDGLSSSDSSGEEENHGEYKSPSFPTENNSDLQFTKQQKKMDVKRHAYVDSLCNPDFVQKCSAEKGG